MITNEHAQMTDRQQIFDLWRECFGADEPEFINKFLDSFFTVEDCYVARSEDGQIAGMLFMLPYRLKNGSQTLSAAYLYAAATKPQLRGEGIFTSLHEYAKEELRREGADCIITVPETKSLYTFYARFGYEPKLLRTVRRAAGRSPEGYGKYLRGIDKNNYAVVMDKKSFELTLDGKVFTPDGFVRDGKLYGDDLSETARTEPSGMLLDLSGKCKGTYGLAFLLN